ncbi:sugar ABC transporter ATP-binding protein [Pelagicoccus sp. SDUM812005]|uniref:sugar ABC transporter ATP-binding protein n=1 Tax=Pelagicoccus sp. SDUM812005 TaxID=3041257 RepID=UPI00280DFA14|nr:sugar ABC transporter ATP-binding protein [Pelagicoccus sp. SDUM812005]MDQ8179370.1 sugar ABC transporter ATP-binding protein [Pelagicoccus sp. SDUM812005]
MLELRNITKTFPGVRALDSVSMRFRAGEIHGLIGENGAGKSTAIKVVTGIHQPDTGEIWYDGKRVVLENYRDSLAKGIGIVHQELHVIPDASVAENIMIDKLIANRWGIIDWESVYREARRYMEIVGLEVSPETMASGLSAAQKQQIQIAKALSADVRVLLLDEPTSSLTEHEAKRLFVVLNELRQKGVALIFVSHKLEEVFEICDRVTVLRDGLFVGEREVEGLTQAELISMMIGRTCNDEHLGVLNPDFSEVALEARKIVRAGKAKGASFKLHRGEVLGFYGLVGSGRTELARILIGEDRMDSGEVLVRGERVSIESVEECLYRHRIGYVTENRKEEGLFLENPILSNVALPVWPRIRNAVTRRIDEVLERSTANRYAEAMSVKTPSLDQVVGALSGGNQQKVSIGKWLAADCDILIIDEPTVGVDVGAKEQIHTLIWKLAAEQGKSIIVISSDLPEIVRMANRILVFREQEIVGEVKDIDTEAKSYEQVSEAIGKYLV